MKEKKEESQKKSEEKEEKKEKEWKRRSQIFKPANKLNVLKISSFKLSFFLFVFVVFVAGVFLRPNITKERKILTYTSQQHTRKQTNTQK